MLSRHDILDSLLREIQITRHLFGKVPEGAMDFRPSEGQRSTLELLRYQSFCGLGGTYAMGEVRDPTMKVSTVRETTLAGQTAWPIARELAFGIAVAVGEDGPTHHGVFDLSYLRHLTNLTVMAPRDGEQLAAMLRINVLGLLATRENRSLAAASTSSI